MNIEYEHDEIFETAKDDFQSYHSIYVQQRFVWIYSRPINDSIIVGFGEVPVSTPHQYIKITLIMWYWNSFFLFLKLQTTNSEHPFDFGNSFGQFNRIFTKLLFEIRVESIFEKKWFRLFISVFYIFWFQSSFHHRWLEFERIFGHLYMRFVFTDI